MRLVPECLMTGILRFSLPIALPQIVAWRVRAATRRIEHFLVVGAVYRRPTMGVRASHA